MRVDVAAATEDKSAGSLGPRLAAFAKHPRQNSSSAAAFADEDESSFALQLDKDDLKMAARKWASNVATASSRKRLRTAPAAAKVTGASSASQPAVVPQRKRPATSAHVRAASTSPPRKRPHRSTSSVALPATSSASASAAPAPSTASTKPHRSTATPALSYRFAAKGGYGRRFAPRKRFSSDQVAFLRYKRGVFRLVSACSHS